MGHITGSGSKYIIYLDPQHCFEALENCAILVSTKPKFCPCWRAGNFPGPERQSPAAEASPLPAHQRVCPGLGLLRLRGGPQPHAPTGYGVRFRISGHLFINVYKNSAEKVFFLQLLLFLRKKYRYRYRILAFSSSRRFVPVAIVLRACCLFGQYGTLYQSPCVKKTVFFVAYGTPILS